MGKMSEKEKFKINRYSFTDLANALQNIAHIEKVAIFSFTLIIISSIIWVRDFSLILILYSLSCITYSIYLGFYRMNFKYDYSDRKESGSKMEFNRDPPNQLVFILGASLIFFTLATILLFEKI